MPRNDGAIENVTASGGTERGSLMFEIKNIIEIPFVADCRGCAHPTHPPLLEGEELKNISLLKRYDCGFLFNVTAKEARLRQSQI